MNQQDGNIHSRAVPSYGLIQLAAALQRGEFISTMSWPPGHLIKKGLRFHLFGIEDLQSLMAAPLRTRFLENKVKMKRQFTVTKEVRADSCGMAIIDITPALLVDTVNQQMLYLENQD